MSENQTTPRPNLFAIDAELDQVAQAIDALEEGGDELAVQAVVFEYFGNLIEKRDEKLDSYAALITIRQNLAERRKARAAEFQAEADRLKALAKTDEGTVKRLKDTLKLFFEVKGITKLETSFRKFWIQKNGGKVPVIVPENFDATKLPPQFQKITIEVDTDAVRAHLLAGSETIGGIKLGEVGSHVRIK